MTTNPNERRDLLDRSSTPDHRDRSVAVDRTDISAEAPHQDRASALDRLERSPSSHRSEQALTADRHVDRHVARRAVAATGLAAIALIHVLDLPGKITETPYLGVMYIGLAVAALILAELLLVRDDRRVWAATGALAASAIVGYVVNRTVGMPGARDDIGNWLEPLGLASLVVEGFVVLLAVGRLSRR